MPFTFIGSPYDGFPLDHNDLNLYAMIHRVGIYTFVLMPAIEDWGTVKRGGERSGAPLLPYQRVQTASGFEFHFDEDGSALETAVIQDREGAQPAVPIIEPVGQYYFCIKGENPTLEHPDTFTVVDEKDRSWLCCEVDDWNSRVSTSGARHFVNEFCESREQLTTKLSDVLD
ncbi:MAG: hypothetical protein K8T25_20460 [Planctomycetia bacterium]|nr:hypothetical protein [Planctomycetia bacterium]